jgi:hypothetical protein
MLIAYYLRIRNSYFMPNRCSYSRSIIVGVQPPISDPGSAAIQNPRNLGKQGLEYAWACQRIVKSCVSWERGSSGLYIREKLYAIGRGSEMQVVEHV